MAAFSPDGQPFVLEITIPAVRYTSVILRSKLSSRKSHQITFSRSRTTTAERKNLGRTQVTSFGIGAALGVLAQVVFSWPFVKKSDVLMGKINKVKNVPKTQSSNPGHFTHHPSHPPAAWADVLVLAFRNAVAEDECVLVAPRRLAAAQASPTFVLRHYASSIVVTDWRKYVWLLGKYPPWAFWTIMEEIY